MFTDTVSVLTETQREVCGHDGCAARCHLTMVMALQLQASIRSFADAELAPHAAAIDATNDWDDLRVSFSHQRLGIWS
jgi:hypothetical protein